MPYPAPPRIVPFEPGLATNRLVKENANMTARSACNICNSQAPDSRAPTLTHLKRMACGSQHPVWSSAARTQEQVQEDSCCLFLHIPFPAAPLNQGKPGILFGERNANMDATSARNICKDPYVCSMKAPDSGPVVVWAGGCHDKFSNGREEWYVGMSLKRPVSV